MYALIWILSAIDTIGIIFYIITLHLLGCHHLGMQMHGKKARGSILGPSTSRIRREGTVSCTDVSMETSMYIYPLWDVHAAFM
jgi:hypothetical protein